MSTAHAVSQPNPGLIFDELQAYQRSLALKTAIDMDLFTAVAQGANTAQSLAGALSASERGVRILCDFLVVAGFLTKSESTYSLPPTSAVFLDRNSPAYIGIVAQFMHNSHLISPFFNLREVVSKGRTTLPDQGTVSYDNPIWVDFARQMAALARPASIEIAEIMAPQRPMRILDIAAGHGLFGIAIAEKVEGARVTALDWPHVLEVASENAAKAGVADRHELLPGDAFTVEYGGPYDLVLVTNFFHHFDVPTCEGLLRKVHASLAPGGTCVNLDFIINEDRVSPPTPAAFALMMLGTTAAGDVYTFAEYESMHRNAGFHSIEMRTLTRSPEQITIARKA
jgi:2-polyprenyl-3-methyl-5-hydroxy-6-metoxy-1,4-benzoquinol methylase